jgi:type III pantothenate kinase
MLLVLDIGNSNIVIGVFQDRKLLKDWRVGTNKRGSYDEYGIILLNLFRHSGIDVRKVSGAVISCVVPSLQTVLTETVKKYLNAEPLTVSPGIKTGMPILYNNPKDVGADRIVNAIGAYEKYKKEVIIVDFGTATTFDFVSPQGEYVGGTIAPGIMISLDSLCEKASKLPRVELIEPKTVIGKDTVSSIQSGIFYGYVSLVDGMVERIKKEVGCSPAVIATGGLAPLISSGTKTIDHVEPHLTLAGLQIIHERNQCE